MNTVRIRRRLKDTVVDSMLEEALTRKPQLSGPKNIFKLRCGNAATPKHDSVSELLVVCRQREDLFWVAETQPFNFSDEFRRFVGMALPMGVGPHRPGMVLAMKRFANSDWEIAACYINVTYPVLLWREERPRWFKGAVRGTSKA